jgi:hypothetical protein
MIKLDGVPVKTRLPVCAWTFAALATFFSLLSSLIVASGAGHAHHASMTQPGRFLPGVLAKACQRKENPTAGRG